MDIPLYNAIITIADGIFDFASNDAVGYLTTHSPLATDAVTAITSHAYDTNGSKDNLSTIVVALPAWGRITLPRPPDHINLM